MPYGCKLCDGKEQAAFLITPLSGADTTAVGQQCLPLALMSMLSASLNIDNDKLYDLVMQMSGEGELTPEQVNLPTGYVYGPNGDDILSEADVDAGLCGYIHDDWQHCHRKAKHAGRHGKAAPNAGEAAQGPPSGEIPLVTADGRAE